MSDCVEHAMELLREHEYMTGGDGRGSAAPLVCSCGHREKSSSAGEPLQSVHLRHLLFVLDDAGMLASPEHDAAVAAKAWDEGFKQGGPMHDVNYDDPDAHTRNPYRIEREGGAS